ncbi:MAG TPA: hypothetical protein PLF26_21160 [Blastocatellia bacterium]|nr:hypothetical protein [Blastocatellia bacterium]
MARCFPLVLAILALGLPPAVGSTRAATHRTVVVTGDVTHDVTLSRSNVNVLRGFVRVRAGATLRVKPGTTVLCDIGAVLVIEQGARLRAVGTSLRPIVFTSAQPESERRRGDWAGIVVNGFAPVAYPGGVAQGDGGTGTFGGYDGGDSSGALSHVRVEFAGFPITAADRSDALSLRGVGSTTQVERVELLNCDGTGLSVVGGEVNLRRVVSIGNRRSGFSFTKGWTGHGQFLLAQQRSDVRDAAYAGIAADHATPMIANVTVVGGAAGLVFGAGSRGVYRNVVVVGCDRIGVSAPDASVIQDLERGDLALNGAVVEAATSAVALDSRIRTALVASGSRFVERSARLKNPHDESAPEFEPGPDSPALDPPNVAMASTDDFFEHVEFAGAVGSNPEDRWLSGWTSFELPPVPRYLANAMASPEGVAAAFLDGLAAGNIRAMQRLRITKDEFCWYVWPELPASQLPNVSCDFAWSQATLNSLSGLDQTIRSYSGRRFAFVSLRFAGGDEVYSTYTVHHDTRLVLRDESGDERELKLFGSMLETNGQWKLFSFVVD